MKAIRLGSVFALAPAVLLLGCGAYAENQDRYRAIDAAIRQVMCAPNDHDRQVGILMLADAVEAYQGRDSSDTGAEAVEVSMDSFKEKGCPVRHDHPDA